jgi:hypothetical protein
MSQLNILSDTGPSSLYDGTISYIPSDDFQVFTEEPLFSQQTVVSGSNSEFRQPLLIPASLERTGSGPKKPYVLYSNMTKKDFVEWWLQTQFGTQQHSKKKFRWDARQLSDVWKSFDQVAHYQTGEPKVICQRCGRILEHPQQSLNGTTSMKRHLEGGLCQKTAIETRKQPSIQLSLQDMVLILN